MVTDLEVSKLLLRPYLIALHYMTPTLKSLWDECSAVADKMMLEHDPINSGKQDAIDPKDEWH